MGCWSVIQRKCKFCGREAVLQDAQGAKDEKGFVRLYVCGAGHKTTIQGEEKADEDLSGLERLSRFIDELEGNKDA